MTEQELGSILYEELCDVLGNDQAERIQRIADRVLAAPPAAEQCSRCGKAEAPDCCATMTRRRTPAIGDGHAAMLLLDGLTGRKSATVFEAARNAESLIAAIPGRDIVQEPSRRGEALHAVDYLAGIRTILASDMPGEAMRKALEELAGLR